MRGVKDGFITRFRTVIPKLPALHCIIRQAVLFAKLSGHFKDIMDTVMKIVNLVRARSSLQHRLFRALLQNESAEIPLYNEVGTLAEQRQCFGKVHQSEERN